MEFLGDGRKKSAAEFWQYQRDVKNLKARSISSIISAALLQYPDTAAMGRVLQTWNHMDATNMAAPTVFHAVFNEFARLTFADELGDVLADTLLSDTYFWEQRLVQKMSDNTWRWFDDTTTPGRVETRDEILHKAALNVAGNMQGVLGKDPREWQWGRLHRYDFYSPIARSGPAEKWLGGGDYPAAGSGDTLCRSLSKYNDLSTVIVMASLRMVTDLGDADKIIAVLPGGITGRLFDPHTTDQIEPYIDGDPVYWWYSDDQIRSHARHELVLAPAGENHQ